MPKAAVGAALPVALALLLFVLHAVVLGDWIVDDAGITFAYARNLADGHGLVAQPGASPVEGFSNPLWTLTIALFSAAGLFYPVLTPKLLSVGLVLGLFLIIWRDLRASGVPSRVAAVPLFLVSVCSSFVIWTTSGLENPLLALLVGLSAYLCLRVPDQPPRLSMDAVAGAVVALAALTRPDSVVYAGLYPATVLAIEAKRGTSFTTVLRRWGAFLLGFVPVYGTYLLFRLAYYGDWVPNTFYAKQKPSFAHVTPGKFVDLMSAATGDFAPLVILAVVVALVFLAVVRRLSARVMILLAWACATGGVYLVMPTDWMGEFRFATAFFPILFWMLTEIWQRARPLVQWTPAARVAAGAMAVAFGLQVSLLCAARTLAFADNPTVPLERVQVLASAYNDLADLLGAGNSASILTPDLGGALLESRLRIYDLAGLCDRRIAVALSRGDRADIREYVYSELKPTFIRMHGAFVRASTLHDDPRFVRDYVAIHEDFGAPAGWDALWQAQAAPAWAGDYVRRDALGTSGASHSRLVARYTSQGLDRVMPWRRQPDPVGWPQLGNALRTLEQLGPIHASRLWQRDLPVEMRQVP